MTRPPLTWFLLGAFVAAGMVAWLPVHVGGVHGYQTLALVMALAWLSLFTLGLGLYGRRGLWLLLASPPALFWLYAVGGALVCARGCG
jgi:hypothetical protein